MVIANGDSSHRDRSGIQTGAYGQVTGLRLHRPRGHRATPARRAGPEPRREPARGAVGGGTTRVFDLAEVLSWIRALPRMEAHAFDAGHVLPETHAAAAMLVLDFIGRAGATAAGPAGA